jgi:hypothetical protein
MSRYFEAKYVEFAHLILDSDEMSFDEAPVVATGNGPGAWVQGWFWVTDESVRKMILAQQATEQQLPPLEE